MARKFHKKEKPTFAFDLFKPKRLVIDAAGFPIKIRCGINIAVS